MDEATWLALTVVLTALGGLWTVYSWRKQGVAWGVRAAGVTLLAPAAYLTDTLRLAGDIAHDVGRWAGRLVFSPIVWTGVGVAALGALLYVVGGMLAARGIGTKPRAGKPDPRTRPVGSGGQAPAVSAPRSAPAPASPKSAGSAAPVDDDLADIEAILKRRGIN